MFGSHAPKEHGENFGAVGEQEVDKADGYDVVEMMLLKSVVLPVAIQKRRKMESKRRR